MDIHWVILATLATVLTACQNSGAELQVIEEMHGETVISDSNLIGKLQSGDPVFGIFARPQTAEGGSIAGKNRDADFVFYSLESGPWDIPGLENFRQAMDNSDDGSSHPITLRIPPIRRTRTWLGTPDRSRTVIGLSCPNQLSSSSGRSFSD